MHARKLSMHTPTPDPQEDEDDPEKKRPPVPPDEEDDVVPQRDPPDPGTHPMIAGQVAVGYRNRVCRRQPSA